MTENEAAALAELRAWRAGLDHREIAERLGMSRSRVGQIERQALEKLRRLARSDRPTTPLERIDAALERARATTREKD